MGISERRQREKQNLRNRILDAARKIVAAEGFDALTIRRVAETVEYAPGTLYLYFENRDAIARALCLDVYQGMHDALMPLARIKDPQRRLREIVHQYVAFALGDPKMYRLAFMSDQKFSDVLLREGPLEGPDGAGQRAFALLVKTIAELGHEIDAFQLAEMVWVSMHGLVSLKIACHNFPATPVNRLGDALAESLLVGILQRKLAPPVRRKSH